MSGTGVPGTTAIDAHGLRVAVAATRWHRDITDALLAGAMHALTECRVSEPTVVRVPGAFELPIVANALAKQGHDAVVCLGLVLRGGTPHFQYICNAVTDGCSHVALSTGVPVGFGILTCDSLAQARDRAGLPDSGENKGREAAFAALETAVLLRDLRLGVAGQ